MKKIFQLLLFVQISISHAQNFQFKTDYNVLNNSMLDNYFSFEGINFSQNNISGEIIKDKNFNIYLKEYKKGKLVNTMCIAKSDKAYYAIIDSTNFRFNILGKRTSDIFLIKLFFKRFSTKKFQLKLISKFKEDYILKEIPLNKESLKINTPFLFLILTTPEYFADGSASWCDVVANETPDKIYEKNKIPHFFIFEMTILD